MSLIHNDTEMASEVLDAFVTYLRSDTDKATFKHDITLAEDYKMNISQMFDAIYETNIKAIRSKVSAGFGFNSADKDAKTITLNGNPNIPELKIGSTLRFDSHTKRICDPNKVCTVLNLEVVNSNKVITVDEFDRAVGVITGVTIYAVDTNDLSNVFEGGLNLDTNNLYSITQNITDGDNKVTSGITASGDTKGALFRVEVTNREVTSVTCTKSGFGYKKDDVLTLSVPSLKLAGPLKTNSALVVPQNTITNGTTGNNASINATGGSGSGAVVTVEVAADGTIVSIKATAAGDGYRENDELTIAVPTTNNAGPIKTSTDLNVTNNGNSTAAEGTFNDLTAENDTKGAIFTVVVDNTNTVTSIQATTAGTGYKNNEQLSIKVNHKDGTANGVTLQVTLRGQDITGFGDTGTSNITVTLRGQDIDGHGTNTNSDITIKLRDQDLLLTEANGKNLAIADGQTARKLTTLIKSLDYYDDASSPNHHIQTELNRGKQIRSVQNFTKIYKVWEVPHIASSFTIDNGMDSTSQNLAILPDYINMKYGSGIEQVQGDLLDSDVKYSLAIFNKNANNSDEITKTISNMVYRLKLTGNEITDKTEGKRIYALIKYGNGNKNVIKIDTMCNRQKSDSSRNKVFRHIQHGIDVLTTVPVAGNKQQEEDIWNCLKYDPLATKLSLSGGANAMSTFNWSNTRKDTVQINAANVISKAKVNAGPLKASTDFNITTNINDGTEQSNINLTATGDLKGASFTVVVDNTGAVTSVQATTAGSGYAENEQLTIAVPSGAGTSNIVITLRGSDITGLGDGLNQIKLAKTDDLTVGDYAVLDNRIAKHSQITAIDAANKKITLSKNLLDDVAAGTAIQFQENRTNHANWTKVPRMASANAANGDVERKFDKADKQITFKAADYEELIEVEHLIKNRFNKDNAMFIASSGNEVIDRIETTLGATDSIVERYLSKLNLAGNSARPALGDNTDGTKRVKVYKLTVDDTQPETENTAGVSNKDQPVITLADNSSIEVGMSVSGDPGLGKGNQVKSVDANNKITLSNNLNADIANNKALTFEKCVHLDYYKNLANATNGKGSTDDNQLGFSSLENAIKQNGSLDGEITVNDNNVNFYLSYLTDPDDKPDAMIDLADITTKIGAGVSGLQNNLTVTANIDNGTPGTHQNISTSSNGKGTGAECSVTVDNNGAVTAVTVTTAGEKYAEGEVLTLAVPITGGTADIKVTLKAGDLVNAADNVFTHVFFKSGIKTTRQMKNITDLAKNNYIGEFILANNNANNLITGITRELKFDDHIGESDQASAPIENNDAYKYVSYSWFDINGTAGSNTIKEWLGEAGRSNNIDSINRNGKNLSVYIENQDEFNQVAGLGDNGNKKNYVNTTINQQADLLKDAVTVTVADATGIEVGMMITGDSLVSTSFTDANWVTATNGTTITFKNKITANLADGKELYFRNTDSTNSVVGDVAYGFVTHTKIKGKGGAAASKAYKLEYEEISSGTLDDWMANKLNIDLDLGPDNNINSATIETNVKTHDELKGALKANGIKDISVGNVNNHTYWTTIISSLAGLDTATDPVIKPDTTGKISSIEISGDLTIPLSNTKKTVNGVEHEAYLDKSVIVGHDRNGIALIDNNNNPITKNYYGISASLVNTQKSPNYKPTFSIQNGKFVTIQNIDSAYTASKAKLETDPNRIESATDVNTVEWLQDLLEFIRRANNVNSQPTTDKRTCQSGITLINKTTAAITYGGSEMSNTNAWNYNTAYTKKDGSAGTLIDLGDTSTEDITSLLNTVTLNDQDFYVNVTEDKNAQRAIGDLAVTKVVATNVSQSDEQRKDNTKTQYFDTLIGSGKTSHITLNGNVHFDAAKITATQKEGNVNNVKQVAIGPVTTNFEIANNSDIGQNTIDTHYHLLENATMSRNGNKITVNVASTAEALRAKMDAFVDHIVAASVDNPTYLMHLVEAAMDRADRNVDVTATGVIIFDYAAHFTSRKMYGVSKRHTSNSKDKISDYINSMVLPNELRALTDNKTDFDLAKNDTMITSLVATDIDDVDYFHSVIDHAQTDDGLDKFEGARAGGADPVVQTSGLNESNKFTYSKLNRNDTQLTVANFFKKGQNASFFSKSGGATEHQPLHASVSTKEEAAVLKTDQLVTNVHATAVNSGEYLESLVTLDCLTQKGKTGSSKTLIKLDSQLAIQDNINDGIEQTNTLVPVFLTTGAGTGAKFTVVVGAGGAVTSVKATNAGTGYVSNEVLTINVPKVGGGNSAMKIKLRNVDLEFDEITLNNVTDLRVGDRINDASGTIPTETTITKIDGQVITLSSTITGEIANKNLEFTQQSVDNATLTDHIKVNMKNIYAINNWIPASDTIDTRLGTINKGVYKIVAEVEKLTEFAGSNGDKGSNADPAIDIIQATINATTGNAAARKTFIEKLMDNPNKLRDSTGVTISSTSEPSKVVISEEVGDNANRVDYSKLNDNSEGKLVLNSGLNVSNNINNGVNQTNTNLGASETTGNGSGAAFTVVVDANGAVTSVQATTAGTGYKTGEVLTIAVPSTAQGGSEPLKITLRAQDIEIKYNTISSYFTTNGGATTVSGPAAALRKCFVTVATEKDAEKMASDTFVKDVTATAVNTTAYFNHILDAANNSIVVTQATMSDNITNVDYTNKVTGTKSLQDAGDDGLIKTLTKVQGKKLTVKVSNSNDYSKATAENAVDKIDATIGSADTNASPLNNGARVTYFHNILGLNSSKLNNLTISANIDGFTQTNVTQGGDLKTILATLKARGPITSITKTGIKLTSKAEFNKANAAEFKSAMNDTNIDLIKLTSGTSGDHFDITTPIKVNGSTNAKKLFDVGEGDDHMEFKIDEKDTTSVRTDDLTNMTVQLNPKKFFVNGTDCYFSMTATDTFGDNIEQTTSAGKLNLQNNNNQQPTDTIKASYGRNTFTLKYTYKTWDETGAGSFTGVEKPISFAETDKDFKVNQEGTIIANCFLAGTIVNTPSGPKAIETLRQGDKVNSSTGVSTVDRLILTSVKPVDESAVYTIPQGSFGSVPTAPVSSSKRHMIKADGKWKMMRTWAAKRKARKENLNEDEKVNFYNLKLASGTDFMVSGLPAKSL